MITVEPHKSFILKQIGRDSQEAIDKEIRNMVASIITYAPREIDIRNQTKTCLVQVDFNNAKLTITVTNPEDEVFKL